MAHVDVKFDFQLHLSGDELRLVGLGLTGQLKGEELEQAKHLNLTLLEQRDKQARQAIERCESALKKARELCEKS